MKLSNKTLKKTTLYLLILFSITLAKSLPAQHKKQSNPSELSDLRPAFLKHKGIDSQRVRLGQEILKRCYKAHGWNKAGSVNFIETIYRDIWADWGNAYNPWPNQNQLVKHQIKAKRFQTSRVFLLEGKGAGQLWGIANGKTYKAIDGNIGYQMDGNILFFLPTYEYFLQIPFWMQSVPVVCAIGDTTFKGVEYDLVFGTWQSHGPNPKFDQYIYWINKHTHLLEFVQYTMRDASPDALGSMYFSDFREVDGLVIPFHHSVVREPGGSNPLHELILESFDTNPADVSAEVFYPDQKSRSITNGKERNTTNGKE